MCIRDRATNLSRDSVAAKKKKRSDSYLNARELNSNFFPYSLLNAPTLLFSKKIFKNMKLKF